MSSLFLIPLTLLSREESCRSRIELMSRIPKAIEAGWFHLRSCADDSASAPGHEHGIVIRLTLYHNGFRHMHRVTCNKCS